MSATTEEKIAIIEAGNIRGLGSVAVCKEIVVSLLPLLAEPNFRMKLIAADRLIGELRGVVEAYPQLEIVESKNSLSGKISRLASYFVPWRALQSDALIVLGDLPFRTKANQIVFLQQANLISPQIDPLVGDNLKFKIMRFIFSRNIRFVKRVVVQTEFMRRNILLSYSIPPDRLAVTQHELPSVDVSPAQIKKHHRDSSTKLFFYPASHYEHKNHAVLWAAIPIIERLNLDVRFDLTIESNDVPEAIRNSPIIRCLGALTAKECRDYYNQCDALFFPSKLESYGLPLAEALRVAKIPVLAADRPFAREACGELAIYFNHKSAEDLVIKLKTMLESWCASVDDEQINKLPNLISWNDVAKMMQP